MPYILNNVGNPGVENFHRNTLTPLEEYNINLQSLVENAAMLHRAGINAFEIESNGKTLHDAVAWMAAILKDRTESLEAFREKWGKFRHFRGSSINYHLGWVPIYLTLFPEKEFAMDLRQVFLKVPYSNTSNFTPKNLGGNPQCIWGFEPS